MHSARPPLQDAIAPGILTAETEAARAKDFRDLIVEADCARTADIRARAAFLV
jgi:hypothetical protein